MLKWAESNIYYLKGTEKSQAERIVNLFKVLTSKEQSMNNIDFIHAIRQVDLSYNNILNMYTDLDIVYVS